MILQDYNYSEALVSLNAGDELLLAKLKTILTEPSKSRIKKNLKNESLRQKQLSEQMWKQVFKKINEN
jgi:hypothetical protein